MHEHSFRKQSCFDTKQDNIVRSPLNFSLPNNHEPGHRKAAVKSFFPDSCEACLPSVDDVRTNPYRNGPTLTSRIKDLEEP